jgi:3-oxoacyl-[acyl-carrier protein] reductase
MNLDLTGRRALVGGSTQGIGKAVAQELALMGAHVTLIARNAEELEKVKAGLIVLKQQKHHTLVADFSNPEEVKEVVSNYLAKGNEIHILVNNTGGPAGGPILQDEPEKFLVTFSQHLICNHVLAQLAIDGMIASGYGRIINIISTSVKAALPGLGVSNTIRAAVANWAKTLANEVGKYGVTVNNVLPGATATQRLETIIKNKANKNTQPEDEVKNEMLKEIPLGRFAEAAEIANAVAFLASPAAAYITGINLPVDGGRLSTL